MTEIEMAIERISLIKRGCAKWVERAYETALTALREQAERGKGCVWCRGDNQATHNGEHFCFFCSYCGKRLEVEP